MIDCRANLAKEILTAFDLVKGEWGVIVGFEPERRMQSMDGTLVDQETLGVIMEHGKTNDAEINYSSEYWNVYQQKYGFTVVDIAQNKISLFAVDNDGGINKYFESVIPYIDDYKAGLTSIKHLSEGDSVFSEMAKKELIKIRSL